MLRRRGNDRGLAEIVGTLMLVLIVVSAAVAFAFFVQSYQSQLQASEAAQHLRSLEALHVISVEATPNSTANPSFATLVVTIASGDIHPMVVQDLLINGLPVVSYNATYLQNKTTVSVGVIRGGMPSTNDSNSTLFVPALQQIAISLDLNHSHRFFSFQSQSDIPTANTYLTLDFYTTLGNSFTGVYVPPTALAQVTYLQTSNGMTTVENPVLDGTNSFQEGGNATIVQWLWSITNVTLGYSGTASGADVEPSMLMAGAYYNATLTVRSSIGLFAVSLPVTFLFP